MQIIIDTFIFRHPVASLVTRVGDTAPDFTLQGVHEGEIDTYTLSDYTEKGPVLLGVYVHDFSPVCSSQMCLLSDIDWFQFKKGLTTLGIARDGPYSHMEFAEQERISYPLLCDINGEVLESYGVLNREPPEMRGIPQRALFLVDSDRTVQYRWVAEDNWDDSNFGTNPVKEALERL